MQEYRYHGILRIYTFKESSQDSVGCKRNKVSMQGSNTTLASGHVIVCNASKVQHSIFPNTYSKCIPTGHKCRKI